MLFIHVTTAFSSMSKTCFFNTLCGNSFIISYNISYAMVISLYVVNTCLYLHDHFHFVLYQCDSISFENANDYKSKSVCHIYMAINNMITAFCCEKIKFSYDHVHVIVYLCISLCADGWILFPFNRQFCLLGTISLKYDMWLFIYDITHFIAML